MTNFNSLSLQNLNHQKASWQNLPTKAVRIPECFEEEVLRYVRSLDNGLHPVSFEDIIAALNSLNKSEIEQLKLAVDCISESFLGKHQNDPSPLPQYGLDKKFALKGLQGGTGAEEQRRKVTPIDFSSPLLKSPPAPLLPQQRDVLTERYSPPPTPDYVLSESEMFAYKAKFGFVPSNYQLAIIDWILNELGHGCCNAVAGSGKSSTLSIVAKTLEESGLKPSEIKICVFGKLNAQDLIKKFGQAWKESISTIHSAGFSLVKKELGIRSSYDIDINGQKYKRIAQDLDLIPKRNNPIGRLRSEHIIGDDNDFLKLIDLVRLTNQQPTRQVVQDIALHFEIDDVWKPDLVARWIEFCLKIGEEQAIKKECLDFTDQIWLPVKWKLNEAKWFRPYKVLLVDEAQDLNAAQLELVMILAGSSGRILAVGDPRQAIFGFAGADNQSYQKITERTNAVELPLSICYRCPISHIELVKKIYPDIPIEPSPTATEGTITHIKNEQIEGLIKAGDMVIGRKTAPLVSLCIKLISRGTKCTVKGKDIGESLKKDLDDIVKVPGYNFQFFNHAVSIYHRIKAQKYQGLDNEEQLLKNLEDKMQAITIIYQSQPQAINIDDLKYYIGTLFSDTNSPVTLSTCHRAKGLESDRIFIYKPEDMPMTWKNQQAWQLEQEQNLLYVALTRSKSELFIVGDPEWYSQRNSTGKKQTLLL